MPQKMSPPDHRVIPWRHMPPRTLRGIRTTPSSMRMMVFAIKTTFLMTQGAKKGSLQAWCNGRKKRLTPKTPLRDNYLVRGG
jgi:hypothetical protein